MNDNIVRPLEWRDNEKRSDRFNISQLENDIRVEILNTLRSVASGKIQIEFAEDAVSSLIDEYKATLVDLGNIPRS